MWISCTAGWLCLWTQQEPVLRAAGKATSQEQCNKRSLAYWEQREMLLTVNTLFGPEVHQSHWVMLAHSQVKGKLWELSSLTGQRVLGFHTLGMQHPLFPLRQEIFMQNYFCFVVAKHGVATKHGGSTIRR